MMICHITDQAFWLLHQSMSNALGNLVDERFYYHPLCLHSKMDKSFQGHV